MSILGQISSFRSSHDSFPINQLAFADDCLLLVKAYLHEAEIMSNIVEEYCSLSGQAINVNKSCIRYGRVVHHRHKRILCRSLGMSKTKGPFKYLGVIIDGKRVPISNYQYLYDRSKSRVSG